MLIKRAVICNNIPPFFVNNLLKIQNQMRQLLLFAAFLMFSSTSYAQEACGTVITEKEVLELQQLLAKPNARSAAQNAVKVRIPIKFHSIRKSDGTGGLTTANKDNLINQINSFYINSDIEFVHQGEVNYINSDDLWDFNTGDEGVAAVGNDISGVINVYFFNTISSSSNKLCGYTRFPPSSDRVFVAYSCVLNGKTTLEHELGHYFTLFHTHGTTNTGTTDELVNGSNCSTAGDRLCDTPADPNLTGKVNSDCIYTGTAQDANGDFYKPMVSNIMSYAPDHCQNKFTPDQYARIREGFEDGRAYLNFEAEGFTANFFTQTRERCIDQEVRYEAVSFGASSFSWQFEGGTPLTSTAENPRVKYSTGGKFNVTLTATSGAGQQATEVKTDYIEIIDPFADQFTDSINSTFDEVVPVEIYDISNPDKSLTWEHNNFDANNNNFSGSVYVNNYSYNSEQIRNIDILSTPYYTTEGIKTFTISFELAYAQRKGTFDGETIWPTVNDSLAINIVTSCGAEGQVIWKKGGENLSTVPEMEVEFFPNAMSDWSRVSLQYDVKEGEQFALFQFRNISFNGNNLYLDNIEIHPDYSLNPPTNFRIATFDPSAVTLRWFDQAVNELGYVIERAINDGEFEVIGTVGKNVQMFVDNDISSGNFYTYRLYAQGVGTNQSPKTEEILFEEFITAIETIDDNENSLHLYPNPGNGKIFLSGNTSLKNGTITVSDLNGKLLYHELITLDNQVFSINLNLQSGIYVVKFSSQNYNKAFKVIINN